MIYFLVALKLLKCVSINSKILPPKIKVPFARVLFFTDSPPHDISRNFVNQCVFWARCVNYNLFLLQLRRPFKQWSINYLRQWYLFLFSLSFCWAKGLLLLLRIRFGCWTIICLRTIVLLIICYISQRNFWRQLWCLFRCLF